MPDNSYDQIYCYEDSDVLINKFDQKDSLKLKQLERTFSAARLIELYKEPISGSFDVAHLKRIHFWIFQDIYSWAGYFRTVDISKGTLFCHAIYIPSQTQKLLTKLKGENYLEGLSFEVLCERVAYYLGEINAIHPFRDGNGRTQREFIRELLLPLGYSVDYTLVDAHEMLMASIASFNGDNTLMNKIFKNCIVKL